jgi:hypothetical protein
MVIPGTPLLAPLQVSYLSALIDLDGDRLITAEEILEAFKQVGGCVGGVRGKGRRQESECDSVATSDVGVYLNIMLGPSTRWFQTELSSCAAHSIATSEHYSSQ